MGVALKRSTQASRKCTVNKGSEVRAQRRPTNGLPSDQVLLSSLSRASSHIPLRTGSPDHRPQAALKTQRAGAMRHNIVISTVTKYCAGPTQ